MPAARHSYRTCRDRDFPRQACQAWKEAWAEASAEDFADGIASCPRQHR